MPHDWHRLDTCGRRLGNGVKVRADGAGDGFALAHRDLGRGFHMHDIDALFGLEVFGANTGDRLFMEYEPDSYQNRLSLVRRFAVVALFDRKKSVDLARSSYTSLSAAFYLYLCRALGARQPKLPRFFFCCGDHEGPWRLLEIDAASGDEIGLAGPPVDGSNIAAVWRQIGLSALRAEMRSWVVAEHRDPVA